MTEATKEIKSDQMRLLKSRRSMTCWSFLKGMVVWCFVLPPRHTFGSLESNPVLGPSLFFFFLNPIKLARLALPRPVTTTILAARQGEKLPQTAAASTVRASKFSQVSRWWNPSRQAGGQAGQFCLIQNQQMCVGKTSSNFEFCF